MIDDIINFVKTEATRFGAKDEDYLFRNNTGESALNDNGAFFGFIQPKEQHSGQYSDFSLVIFPNAHGSWLVSLGVGTLGFKGDYELAIQPGTRRLFAKLIDENGYCKTDLSDLESNLPKDILNHEKLESIKKTINIYKKVLPICQIVDISDSEKSKNIISAFIASYARMRNWASNNGHREAIEKAIKLVASKMESNNSLEEVKELLIERKYIILQGSPGTGKTRLAKLLADELKIPKDDVFFTQFHAETSYSDFIYGIRPSTEENNLSYHSIEGIFTRALKNCTENKRPTLLIIDEINRANLSNILGPIFYLFEYKQDSLNIECEITPKYKINEMPENFYVVGTMNTADRSLAVVDFALRRRFAWYTMKPRNIGIPDKQLSPIKLNGSNNYFYVKEFQMMNSIFERFASSSELLLQPGQGYFIASEKGIENRIRYELYPLISEYLQEGMLINAKEELNSFFISSISLSLFQ